MNQPQNLIPQQSLDQDYEISILDILVVLAENLRLIILIPLLVGITALGITFLIPKTYQSVSLLGLGEVAVTGIKSEEVMNKVLEKTDWIHAPNHEAALKKLGKKLQVSFDKKDGVLKIVADAPTPQKAEALSLLLINEYRIWSHPKGKALESINENIRITTENIATLELAAKKITPELDKVALNTEGENVARTYATITANIATLKSNLFNLKQSLVGFGPEVFIQKPTLPDKPIKPKKAQIAIMATLASGFLTILFVFIRAAFRNLGGDAEASEKLARIRTGFGLK